MMISSDGYTISEYPNQNKIEIGLPQTFLIATNAVSPIDNNRKGRLTTEDLTILLNVVKKLYSDRENIDRAESELWKNHGIKYGISSRIPLPKGE